MPGDRSGRLRLSRESLLRKLLFSGHLNVSERTSLRPCAVLRSEIVGIVKEALAQHRYFPPAAAPWKPGDACYEGWFFEGQKVGVRLHWQRSPATSPFHLAEQTHRDFRTLREAVDFYVEQELRGQISGIPVRA